MTIYTIDTSKYVSIPTHGRLLWKKINDEKKKKTPAAERRREHGLGRYLHGREGRAR